MFNVLKIRFSKDQGKNYSDWYLCEDGGVFNMEGNETLDSASIVIKGLTEELDLQPLDYCELCVFNENGEGQSGILREDGFIYHLLINSWQKSTTRQINNKTYNYSITLISETKLLEGRALPNLTITNDIKKDSVLDYVKRYNELYGGFEIDNNAFIENGLGGDKSNTIYKSGSYSGGEVINKNNIATTLINNNNKCNIKLTISGLSEQVKITIDKLNDIIIGSTILLSTLNTTQTITTNIDYPSDNYAKITITAENILGNKYTFTYEPYSVDIRTSNCSLIGVRYIWENQELNYDVKAEIGYELPNNVIINGASVAYNKNLDIAQLRLFDAYSNVSGDIIATRVGDLSIVYQEEDREIVENYLFIGAPSTIPYNGSISFTITTKPGFRFPAFDLGQPLLYTNDTYTTITLGRYNPTFNQYPVTISHSGSTSTIGPSIYITIREAVEIPPMPETYNITHSLTNITYSGSETITEGHRETITLTSQGNYVLPRGTDFITITGATIDNDSYDFETDSDGYIISCSFDIENPTGDVSITASAIEKATYSITYNLTGLFEPSEHTIPAIWDAELELDLEFTSGYYTEPISVSVVNCSYELDGTHLRLYNPFGNITVNATASPKTYNIEYELVGLSYRGDNFIKYGETKTINLIADIGYMFGAGSYFIDNVVIPPNGQEVSTANFTATLTSNGVLTLSNVKKDLRIRGVALELTYSITFNTNHIITTTQTRTLYGGRTNTFELEVDNDTFYELPDTLYINGVDVSNFSNITYWKNRGLLVIDTPDTNMVVSGNATPLTYNIVLHDGITSTQTLTMLSDETKSIGIEHANNPIYVNGVEIPRNDTYKTIGLFRVKYNVGAYGTNGLTIDKANTDIHVFNVGYYNLSYSGDFIWHKENITQISTYGTQVFWFRRTLNREMPDRIYINGYQVDKDIEPLTHPYCDSVMYNIITEDGMTYGKITIRGINRDITISHL